MSTLPIISIKSEDLQRQLGIKMDLSKAARRRSLLNKLDKMGIPLIDNEFIQTKDLEAYAESKMKKITTTHASTSHWLEDSSFKEFG